MIFSTPVSYFVRSRAPHRQTPSSMRCWCGERWNIGLDFYFVSFGSPPSFPHLVEVPWMFPRQDSVRILRGASIRDAPRAGGCGHRRTFCSPLLHLWCHSRVTDSWSSRFLLFHFSFSPLALSGGRERVHPQCGAVRTTLRPHTLRPEPLQLRCLTSIMHSWCTPSHRRDPLESSASPWRCRSACRRKRR